MSCAVVNSLYITSLLCKVFHEKIFYDFAIFFFFYLMGLFIVRGGCCGTTCLWRYDLHVWDSNLRLVTDTFWTHPLTYDILACKTLAEVFYFSQAHTTMGDRG